MTLPLLPPPPRRTPPRPVSSGAFMRIEVLPVPEGKMVTGWVEIETGVRRAAPIKLDLKVRWPIAVISVASDAVEFVCDEAAASVVTEIVSESVSEPEEDSVSEPEPP